MTVPTSPQSLEARFAYLLQPIKDLAKNWNIDIAHDLEQYLCELEKVTITFDGGITNVNFVEAALVIQGSACVYSKKVEYLYRMVCDMLDMLARRKKRRLSSCDAGEQDSSICRRKDKHEEFLSLDDVPETANVNIKEDLGIQLVRIIPRTPISLVPLAETEKGKTLLLSAKGELLGNKDDFRLNLSTVHPSGVLLLDLSHLSLVNGENKAPEPPLVDIGTTETVQLPNGGVTDNPPDNLNDSGVDEECMPMVDDDDDAAGPIAEMVRNAKELESALDVKAEPVEKSSPLRKSARIAQALKTSPHTPPKPVINVWEMSDPHRCDSSVDKQFKKGRPFKVPAKAQEKKQSSKTQDKKPKKVPKKLQVKPHHIIIYCLETFEQNDVVKLPKNATKRPSCTELKKQFMTEQKKRQELQRQKKKQLVAQGRVREIAEIEQREAEMQKQQEAEKLADVAEDDNFVDGFPALSDGVDDDLDDDSGDAAAQEPPLTQGAAEAISSYEELVRHRVEEYMESAEQYANVTELARRVNEWESKILPKLDEEDHRSNFDIHTYESTILTALSATPSSMRGRIPFRQIVAKKDTHETSRLFLASLQLANAGNIQIFQDEQGEKGVDTMALGLLSYKRHLETLQDYQAPSLQKQNKESGQGDTV